MGPPHLPDRPEDFNCQGTFQCWHAPADTRCLSLSAKLKLCFKYILSKKRSNKQKQHINTPAQKMEDSWNSGIDALMIQYICVVCDPSYPTKVDPRIF